MSTGPTSPSDQKFRVMLRMRIRPGMEKEFERTWYEIGGAVTENAANIGQWLTRSAEEDGIYFVVSDWTNEERFREFEHSERHLSHRQKLHPFRIDGDMTTMHIVYDMAGAASGAAAATRS